LQQVGAREFANAQAVDPRKLPVPIRELRRNVAVRLGHVWVLHRRIVVRVAGAVLALLFIFGAYQARDAIGVVGSTVASMVQGEFVAAGFGIEAIEVGGQKLTSDTDIATMLALSSGRSTLTFDAQKAQARLNWLQAVESVTVRKIYPDRVVVDIVEKEPVLRWRIGEQNWLVDGAGKAIAEDTGAYTDLPLIVGDGAADDALIMINSLSRHDILRNDLAALSRIGDRRWDLIYYTGLRVQLPEQGVAQALSRLEMYQRDHALLDRDVTLIDLRVPGVDSGKPAIREN